MSGQHQNAARIEALVEEGQALVHSLAARIRRNVPIRVDLDDLIAYGEVGLAEAARDYDPDNGASFTTFAYYRIRGAIYDGVARMSWTGRAYCRRRRFQRAAREYLAAHTEASSHDDRGSLEDNARWLRDATDSLAVIFFGSFESNGESDYESTLEDTAAEPASVIAARREIVAQLHDLLGTLPRLEERLIREVYFNGATLQEAGEFLGISKSWASRLHARALERLAAALRRKGIRN